MRRHNMIDGYDADLDPFLSFARLGPEVVRAKLKAGDYGDDRMARRASDWLDAMDKAYSVDPPTVRDEALDLAFGILAIGIGVGLISLVLGLGITLYVWLNN